MNIKQKVIWWWIDDTIKIIEIPSITDRITPSKKVQSSVIREFTSNDFTKNKNKRVYLIRSESIFGWICLLINDIKFTVIVWFGRRFLFIWKKNTTNKEIILYLKCNNLIWENSYCLVSSIWIKFGISGLVGLGQFWLYCFVWYQEKQQLKVAKVRVFEHNFYS